MKKSAVKKSLFLNLTSLLLCVALLIGTTFAWFTDTASSGVNKIIAGNLDIEVSSKVGDDWVPIQESTSLFSSNLWEPGHTEYVTLKIENKGTLAFNYRVLVSPVNETGGINVYDEEFLLSDYLVFKTTEPSTIDSTPADRNAARELAGTDMKLNQIDLTQTGSILSGGAPQYVTLVVYMPETVGNEANYKTGTTPPEINLGITVYAAQKTEESDSFGNDYDSGAVLPVLPIKLNFKATAPRASSVDTTVTHAESGSQAIIPQAALSAGVTEISLIISTVEYSEKGVTYDISLKDQDGADVAIISGQKVTVRLSVGRYLTNVKVTHGSTPLIEGSDFVYNPATGYLTIYSDSFSPFSVTFDPMQTETDEYGVIYGEKGTILLSAREMPDTVTSYTVRPGVKEIYDSAFSYNDTLTEVILPVSLEKIGDYAFNECVNLKTINLGEMSNLKTIGNRAFRRCYGLETLELPSSLTYIGPAAFSSCENLTSSLVIPAGVTVIEEHLFEGCYKLSGVTFAGDVTSIGRNAFKSCESLTSLVIPASVTTCGNQFIAFERLGVTYHLTSVTFLGDTLPTLGTSVFLHASRPANGGNQLTIYVKNETARQAMLDYLNRVGNITSATPDKMPQVVILP